MTNCCCVFEMHTPWSGVAWMTDFMKEANQAVNDCLDLLGSAASTLGPADCPSTHDGPDVDPRRTDLSYFQASIGDFESLQCGQFTLVKKMFSGISGDVLKCHWHRDDSETQCVAVKKVSNSCVSRWSGAETNERKIHLDQCAKKHGVDDLLTEIGVLTYLQSQPGCPPYFMQMLGVYADDKFTWLVSEFVDGGDMFQLVAAERLSEARVQRFTWQLLQAIAYLHRHKIGHRDISLENILIKDGIAQLMDFGLAVQTCSTSRMPFRYFRAVGKGYYRAPEVYVPTLLMIRAVAPPVLAPDRVAMVYFQNLHAFEVRFPEGVQPGELCVVENWGYRATPADVFASGVCLFMMACKCPPRQTAQFKDRYFSFVCNHGDSGVMQLMRHFDKQLLGPEPTKMLTEMLRMDPSQRPSAAECLRKPWFADMERDKTT